MINNYNTLFKIILSIVLALPISGGSITNLVFFTTLSNILIENGSLIEQYIQQIIRCSKSFNNVNKLISQNDGYGKKTIDDIELIKFEDVNFSYGEYMALNKINAIIEKGDVIRLTGLNGSGKSSFIKLLSGMYHVSNGKITFNNFDINDVSKFSLNNSILYINQDEVLLNDTISNYLKISSNFDIDNNQIQSLMKEFDLDSEKEIENMGLNFSNGQRKKILIMKLLCNYKNSSVIILDEIQAGLDLETKNILVNVVNEISKDKIVLFVEHDESNNQITYNKELNFCNGELISK